MKEFQVIYTDPATRRVTIKPPMPPRIITGIDKLIQIVVLALFNDPGRNVFDPGQGSGLLALIGANMNPNDPTEVIALVTERIEKIKEEILENQNSIINEDPTERLSDIQVLSVETGTQIDEVAVKLRLISEAGNSTTIVI